MTITVLLVDDSTMVRGLISRALQKDLNIQIVANASDGKAAIEMAAKYKPNIIILDVEMPTMDGITAIPHLLESSPKSRIIMASKLTRKSASVSLQALSLGAADYIAKPELDELENFYHELLAKINALVQPTQTSKTANTSAAPILLASTNLHSVRAMAIASSTGGPQALLTVFAEFKDKPLHVPIFITQHMPPMFTSVLADHISSTSGHPCTEGKHGDIVKPGHIYVAPGNFHMCIGREGSNNVIRLNQEAQVNFCRPSADPMFESLSKIYGKHLYALVMTGMGRDGADGAKAIVNAGGTVVAQDEKTSTVYGMPKAVADLGICKAILPLPKIASHLLKAC